MHIHLIEFATPEFDEAVALRYTVLRQPLGLEYTPEQLAEEYDQQHLGAYSDDYRLIGYLNLTPLDTARVKMRQVAVAPAWQKRGVGQAMVEASEQLAREQGFTEIVLHARLPAATFYDKLGYARVGEEFQEVNIPHIKMTKILAPP